MRGSTNGQKSRDDEWRYSVSHHVSATSPTCLSGEGTNAHLLYTWQGESVSLYLLPSDRRMRSSLALLGHDTEVWTGHNGSYVLVTRDTGQDRTELVNYMQHATQ